MRRRIAPVSALVVAVLALAVGLVACGDDSGSSNNTKGDQAKLGGTVKLWIMPNPAQAVRAEDGRQGPDRGRGLGRAVRPHPQRGRVG